MSHFFCHINHPYGVKAGGNSYLADREVAATRPRGLGNLRMLSDELLIDVLSYCNPVNLTNTGLCSRALYIYSHHAELWRDLSLREFNGTICYTNNWKDTYVKKLCENRGLNFRGHNPIRIEGIFSSLLHRTWTCSNFDIKSACPTIFQNEDITRKSSKLLTIDEFVNFFEKPNIPLILTDLVNDWPAYTKWDLPYLQKIANNFHFRATSTTAPMATSFSIAQYTEYSNQSNDEAPFYLFDRDYTQITELMNDYTIPSYFTPTNITHHATDLFRLLGEARRPDYRWLIVGPARSGSIFHIDPNQTNAWNAAIRGRKKWIFYPPGVSPPGVMISKDGSDVMVPLSTGEWLLSFWKHHLEARKHPDPKKRPMECILMPGELIFVPHNWWHMVVNLDECIALTHNYVSSSNLSDCLRFLHNTPDQISGVRDRPGEAIDPDHLYEEFTKKLQENYPSLLSNVMTIKHQEDEKISQKHKNNACSLSKSLRKRKKLHKDLNEIQSLIRSKRKNITNYETLNDNNDCTPNISFTFAFDV